MPAARCDHRGHNRLILVVRPEVGTRQRGDAVLKCATTGESEPAPTPAFETRTLQIPARSLMVAGAVVTVVAVAFVWHPWQGLGDGPGRRLRRCRGQPSQRLADIHALAADACGAASAAARDKVSSERSLDTKLVDRANSERQESARDLGYLLGALKLRVPPGERCSHRIRASRVGWAGRSVTARCWGSEEN